MGEWVGDGAGIGGQGSGSNGLRGGSHFNKVCWLASFEVELSIVLVKLHAPTPSLWVGKAKESGKWKRVSDEKGAPGESDNLT